MPSSGAVRESTMSVAVMDIGPVLVFVHEGRVLVFVTVRTSRVGAGRMFVVMVQVVVGVQVAMCQGLVHVAMFVVLGDVEPHFESHQCARGQGQGWHRVTENADRDDDASEGSDREELAASHALRAPATRRRTA